MGLCITKSNIISNRSIPENINPSSLNNFVPEITNGRVIKCYDGDTITIAGYLPYKESKLYKFSVRINGIDCPEIRSKNENEKKCALIAKKMVENKIINKIVNLQNVKTEKYGRLLADVIIDDLSIGPWLIEQNLAVNYDGKTKNIPNDWLSYYNSYLNDN
tara:strand:+ start:44917 stop:45399 length:483 start_codon:yes stop_codon:yes gene_type:complete